MRAAAAFLFPGLLVAANSLALRSGTTVSGTYAGGDSRTVRFIVGDQVKSFPIADVVRIVFEASRAAAPQPGRSSSGEGWRRVTDPAVSDTPDVADKQRRFCEVIQDYREANIRFTNEPNPIRRAEARKPDPYDWEQRIVALLGSSGRFENWTGTVRFHVDGRHIGASFFPDCKGFPQAIEFTTASRYAFGSRDSNTMIPLHSPIADTLSRTNGNQAVVASGHLFYLAHGNMGNFQTGQKGELRQRYKSAPNYPPASVASPHYLAAFDSITLAH
jgi:hypothetical protein